MSAIIGISCNQRMTSLELFIKEDCIEAISRNGGLPVVIPIVDDLKLVEEYLTFCNGLMLTGGGDIDPLFYGELATCPSPSTCPPPSERPDYNQRRDWFEINLVKMAINLKIPVFAICRGMQVLNVAFGGTLDQDLNFEYHNPGLAKALNPGDQAVRFHHVSFKEHTRLRKILGQKTTVNSYHHQGVKTLGEKLQVSAVCQDGVVEGIESIDEPWVVGVQWHPERMHDSMENLFREFIHAAAAKKDEKFNNLTK